MSKVKVTTYVDERTAGILRARAAQNEISMSEACSRTLQAAVKDEAAEGVGTELLLPSVRAAVRREVGRMSDRLSNLLARSALESAADRRALYQLLVREFGKEQAAEINRQAWMQSVQSMRKPAEGLREVLGEREEESSSEGTDEDSNEDSNESFENGSQRAAADSDEGEAGEVREGAHRSTEDDEG